MARIALINEKGGTLKTTLAVHLAAYSAAFLGRRTLLIDTDPQGNAGKTLGIVDAAQRPSTYEVLTGEVALADAIQETDIDGLSVVVSDKRLGEAPLALARKKEPYMQLRNQIASAKGFGHVFFDSPPSLGVLTRNILAAANEVIVPVSLTYLAIDGCAEVIQTIEQARKDLENPSLRVRNVVPTLFRNTNLANEILSVLDRQFGKKAVKSVIGYAVQIDEAQSHGKTIWQYAPSSRASQIFLDVAQEILGPPKQDGFAHLGTRKRLDI